MKIKAIEISWRARVSAAAMAMAIVFPGSGAHAQPATGAGETLHGNEIIVMARKAEESLQEVPVVVSAFSEQDMTNRTFQDIKDFQRETPTLIFSSTPQDSFSSYVSIRGQPATDILLALQPSVGIYIDGVYQASTLGVGLSDLYDLQRVEVIKGPQGTLYGRNSTGGAISLYSNLPQFEKRTMDFRLRAGNYKTVAAAAAVNLPLGSNAALRMVVQMQNRGEGFGIDLTNGRELDKQTTYSLRGALRFQPTDQFEVILRGDYSLGKNSGMLSRLLALNPSSNGATVAALDYGFITRAEIGDAQKLAIARALAVQRALAESGRRQVHYTPGFDQFQNMEVWSTSATLNYDLTDNVELKSITSYRDVDREFFNEAVDASFFRLLPGIASSTVQKVFTQEFQISGSAIDDRLNYTAGLYYFWSNGTEVRDSGVLPALLSLQRSIQDFDIKNESYSAFTQGSFEIVENLRATAGVRYTDEKVIFTSRNYAISSAGAPICSVPAPDIIDNRCLGIFTTKFNNWSYTFGLDYQATPDVLVYGRTSSGFKAGGINPRGNTLIGSYQAFAPEKVTDYEVGFKLDLLNRKLRLNAAAFLVDYSGLQQSTVVGLPDGGVTSVIANIDPATGRPNTVKTKGFEIETRFQPLRELTLRGSYAYIDPEYKSGRPAANVTGKLQGVANHQASASANLELPAKFGAVSLFGGWSYISRVEFQPANSLILPDGTRFGDDLSGQDHYSLFDARLTFRIDDPGLSVALFGRNLTNKYYYVGSLDTAGAGFGAITGTVGAPRTWGVELSTSF